MNWSKKVSLFVSLSFIFFASQASANIVTPDTARRVALNWMYQQSGRLYQETDIAEARTVGDPDRPSYHVLNFDPEGWVMVSGDDVAYPVIGYSYTGVNKPDVHPPQFVSWMKTISEAISSARKKRSVPPPKTQTAWESLTTDTFALSRSAGPRTPTIGPLLQTTWNQDQYYNEQCPEDSGGPWYAGGHAFAGCVATAMAQVMKYHNYPDQGYGTHSYNHATYGTQSADFGATTYNWAGMPNAISASDFDVAQLIYHCAVSVDMDFGPWGSSGSLSDASEALSNYFRYDESLYYANKIDYTYSEWITLLKTNLDDGRPVLYRGTDGEIIPSGHSFVCDGYQGADYFHFNWGWGGQDDGYYYLSSLTPPDDNYTFDQAAVLDIQPAIMPSLIYPYNQSFEVGSMPTEWRSEGNRVSISTAEANSGSNSLLLGTVDGLGFSEDSATLPINVPENGQLSFWVKRGYDPSASQYNQQSALIKSQFGDQILHTIFDGDFNDADWQLISLDLGSWANQVIKLFFLQANSSTSFTQWMYIDDIQITGGSGPVTPTVIWDTSQSSGMVPEGTGIANFTAKLSTTTDQTVTVPFTVGGTATGNGEDHNLSNGTITIPADTLSASKTFSITEDEVEESDETVIITMGTPTNALKGTPSTHTITIQNDDTGPGADGYEPNDLETSASLLTLTFSGDAAMQKTSDATIHSSTDLDYYRIDLATGYNYTVSARVHDSYDSTDGQIYSCDVKFSYKADGIWSVPQDTSHSPFSVENGGEVIFNVEPYFAWEMGTYALEIEVTKGSTESIVWVSSKSEAMSQALAQGKLVLLLAGRATCGYTQHMKETVCESTDPPIRSAILDSYIPWYCDVDSSTEHYTYTSGLGSYFLPLICRIDPDNQDQYLDRSTGIQDTNAFYERLLLDIVIKGDVNHMNGVTLEDAILSLQTVAGIQTSTIYTDADVDDDECIGIVEAIYVLQEISNTR